MNLILSIEKAIVKWLLQDYRQRALRQATARACGAFIRHCSQWQEVLFDEHFLTHRATPVLEAYLTGLTPDPVVLAQAWADQWGWEPESRANFVATLTPVATRFLDLLERELRGTWVASSRFTSRVAAPLES